MMRAACLGALVATLAAGPAIAQQRPLPPEPLTFEQKMAWVLRLEDQRILRAPATPPAEAAVVQAPPKGRRARPVPAPPLPAPDLVQLLEDPEGRVRRRAAQAVGRVGLAEGVPPLAAVLAGDRDAEVREMAAFAMGLIAHRSAVEPLRAALRDPSMLVQGRAAEALGLIGDTGSAQAIAAVAAAHLPAVTAAALGADDGASPLDPAARAFRLAIFALTRLKAADALLSVVLDPAGQPRVLWWPVAYALSRTDDARVVPALATVLGRGGSLSRAFAARGLGTHKAAGSASALVGLVQGWRTEPRVAVAAIRALAQIGSGEAAAPLRAVAQARDADPNLRLEAIAALGVLKDQGSLDLVLDAISDPWPAMRAAGLRALKEIDLDTFVIVLSGLDADPHPSVRTAVASLLPALGPARAGPRLMALMRGQDPAVAAAAIEAMAGMPEKPDGLAETLERLLVGGDVMVRAAAAAALGELRPPGGERALAAAYTAGVADDLSQARAAALGALAKYGADAATTTLNEALGDREWTVRLRAAALLRELDPRTDAASRIRPAPGRPVEAYAAQALVAPQVSPHVFLDTDTGTIEIELAVLEAPLTAENFLALARRGYFSRMPIHRVVPTFVVQAGDQRGDGEGGPGYTLRDEINMLPYVRGAVGMALDGADTGGSQFFITHAPQPHLDGKYTVFGRVVAGMDVVDRLQQWDVIRRVRTWDGLELVTR
ncbi:MAG: HEAT repeat domain-containing protein [Vicinamibacterales bacterium]|jgi:cyclophilin family peptidyl-prolyl cis-trans isomerase/HEAT repeat protein|nr:HEAT repeat domain-containing protein [Vicinamibacterales bacterium]